MQNLLMMVVRGVAIGAIISAPMGPVGILCVQRTLDGGRRHGFYTGIGASISDLFYCLLTGFGLSFIEGFLQDNQQIIQILGSLVLIGFGIYIMKKNPTKSLTRPPSSVGRKSKDVISGFLFTFSNPLILFLIIGLFARFNFQSPDYRWFDYVVGYISIVTGAVGWWWLITFVVNKVRAHFNVRSMWIVNRVIGIIILIFALFGIISAFTGEAKAAVRVEERIQQQQIWNSVGDEIPMTISAPGPEVGRFSFVEDGEAVKDGKTVVNDPSLRPTPDNEGRGRSGTAVSGIEFVLTNLNSSPEKRYSWIDSDGKKRKTRSPAISLVWVDDSGSEGRLRMSSRLPVTYEGEENGGETELVYQSGSGLVTKLQPLKTLLTDVVFNVDLRESVLDIAIGSGGDFEFPIEGQLESFYVEVEPGGAVRIDEAQVWSRRVPVMNQRIAIGDWSTDEAAFRSYKELAKEFSPDDVSGLWDLYQSREDETYIRRGGDYRVLILPAESEEGCYEIWYLSGGRINGSKWTAGRLKGRLLPTGLPDDWRLEWYDAEGHSCGNALRAHLKEGSLELLFPRHNANLTFIRRPNRES